MTKQEHDEAKSRTDVISDPGRTVPTSRTSGWLELRVTTRPYYVQGETT